MSNYTVADFEPGDRVIYVPTHARGDLNHADCERGKVSSKNEKVVFVKFDQTVAKLGWEGTTSQGCAPSDLEKPPMSKNEKEVFCKIFPAYNLDYGYGLEVRFTGFVNDDLFNMGTDVTFAFIKQTLHEEVDDFLKTTREKFNEATRESKNGTTN